MEKIPNAKDARSEVIDENVMLVRRLHARGEDYNTWIKAAGGVKILDPKTAEVKDSDIWTSRILDPFKVTAIVEDSSITKPGFYCASRIAPFNGVYSDCVELVEKSKLGGKMRVVADPPKTKMRLIIGVDYVHLSLEEKSNFLKRLLNLLEDKETKTKSHKYTFEQYPLDRYDRLIIEYKQSQPVHIEGKDLLVDKIVLILPQTPTEPEKDSSFFPDKAGEIYFFATTGNRVVSQYNAQFFNYLFCDKDLNCTSQELC